MTLRRALPFFAVLLCLLSVDCGPHRNFDDASCPPGGTELTYENFGRGFMNNYCQTCHASTVKDRIGAPEGFFFDNIEDVHRFQDRIYDRSAGDNTSMPPGPDDPPEAARDDLEEWLACGAPGGAAPEGE